MASVECPPPRSPSEDVSLTSGLTASVSLARPLTEPAPMAVQPIKVRRAGRRGAPCVQVHSIKAFVGVDLCI